ncbi:aspartyl/asparaginyl beta-hydroxylase isoform X17 [Macaca thibetana thibetana]|uniref:aspartyl/asparaginyl beta-hydroxylase isoform X17 n=1 Tax=Macaca thibetana thibetana TaxID=257877 RepID=UPI0000D9BFE1|nr:aspartyl/asparaginyl beta-hydroxylase isoform X1 [Macaca nemestrina]XP_050657954.1 aspartyl/asparaginyl beta-hydroxylase isoform X17 [Macaca thibetana thibetana]
MAQRKNAKGSGNSSSSGSGSSSTSAGSSGGSSSPGARRETKHGGHKNGRKGGPSGTSFFTWFMVIALLGVWTSVAVVWFDLVDYEEVLGKLGIYDADGDGDFDVDDAKVLLGLKERSTSEPAVPPEEAEPHAEPEEQAPVEAEPQNIEDEAKEQIQSLLHEMVHAEHVEGEDLQQEDGPTGEPQQEDDEFLTVTVVGDRFETLEVEVSHEETEHSYHVEETVSQDYNQDMEEMMSEQENPDASEPVGEDERLHHDTDDVTYQVYEEQVVYEPPENERIEVTEVTVPPEDNPVEVTQVIVEEVSISPVEEQQEVPPDT